MIIAELLLLKVGTLSGEVTLLFSVLPPFYMWDNSYREESADR